MNLKYIYFSCAIITISCIFSCMKSDVDPIPETDPEMDPDTTTQVIDPIVSNYDLNLLLLGTLPNSVKESSGLALQSATTYWTHNDRGDKAILYLVDDTGQKLREFEINNSKNEDWEDLASDTHGNLYVADTGTNDNDRQDLRIYIVQNSTLANTNGDAQVINVAYEDQIDYPPADDELHYDAEAIIYLNEQIYIFTRDRTLPFVGTTKLYKINALIGNQSAKLLGEYETNVNENTGSITGASVSPDGKKIAIVSNTKMWVFKNFENEDFFGKDIDIFTFNTDTKIEAVAFIDDCKVVLSDEKKDNKGGNLYNADICK